MEKLQQAARVVLEDCMGVKRRISFDYCRYSQREIGDAFEQASKMQAEPLLLEMLPGKITGWNPEA